MALKTGIATFTVLLLAIAPPALAQPKKSAPAAPAAPAADPLADALRARINTALAALDDTGDYPAAAAEVTAAFDAAIAYSHPAAKAQQDLFIDAAFAVRLVSLCAAAPADSRAGTYRYLRSNDELARTLAFLVRDGDPKAADDKAGVCRTLAALRARHEKLLPKHPALAAAICVVHDRPVRDVVAGAERKAADPAALFAYFAANERKMIFDLDGLPPEALTFMVNSTSPIPEMNWALSKYAGNRNVGKRFFEVTYDTRAYRQGVEKKVVAAGVTLENIRKVGGVCAEQAYFATEVGKAIGVPTAFVVGQSGSEAHAWVGFLQQTPSGPRWNFDEGRYDDYEDVRGRIIDPQVANTRLSDSDLAISALALNEPAQDRWFAVATADAARRLRTIGNEGLAYPPARPAGAPEGAARPNTGVARLDLVEQGVRAAPGSIEAWRLVEDLARSTAVPTEQRNRWFELMNSVAGKESPDFMMDVMGALIEGERDGTKRRAAWSWLVSQYNGRAALVARARTTEGRADEKYGDHDAAIVCYQDVIMHYANDGPYVVDAATGVVRVMKALGRKDDSLSLLKDAWQRTKRPGRGSAAAAVTCNYARVGAIYQKALEDAGRARDAADVERQLESLR